MEAWNDIVRAALVGTERQRFTVPPLPDGVGEIVASAGADDALLVAAGVVGTWRAAGLRASMAPQVEEPFALEDESLPYARPAVGHLLRRFIEHAPNALAEALDVLASRGLLAPADTLPDLLDLAARSIEVRPAIARVMGRRGAALARMRREWAVVLGSATGLDASSWDGDRRERAAYLRELRALDPGRARALLAASWKSEPANARTEFVETFEVGLAPDDEPFLESCLDDRSKEVRRVAAELLARLPQSAFVVRMNERARGVLRLLPEAPQAAAKGGLLSRLAEKARSAMGGGTSPRLDIEPPIEADAAAKRDGLEDTAARDDAEKRGVRARMLLAIATTASLDVWTSATGMTPADLIGAVRATDWAATMEQGWLDAATTQRNAEWALALYHAPAQGRDARLNYWKALVVLSPEERNRFAMRSSFENLQRTLNLVALCDAPLSPDLTRAIVEICLRRLPQMRPYGDDATPSLLHHICHRGAPELYPEFAAQAATHPPDQAASGNLLDRELRVYELRHAIYEETTP